MGTWPSERSRNGGVDEVSLPGTTGRLWLCGKHFIGPDHAAAVERVGADVVVCLCHRHELEDRYPGYVTWLAASARGTRSASGTAVDSGGDAEVVAVWFPVDDLHAPVVEQALDLVDALRRYLDAGRTVLVHCGAGVGRAGTLAAAVLMSFGLPRAEALARVAASRPTAGPEAGPQAELLVELELRFRDRGPSSAPTIG